MSSVLDYTLFYDRLTTVIVPIQIVLGILTNVLNIIVLSRRSLLEASPCTHYFRAIAVVSIVAVIVGPGCQFAEKYFMFNPYGTLAGCKLLPYLFVLMLFYISMFFILATFDRFCQSSTVVRIRSWSSVIVARRAVISAAIIPPILLSPTMIVWYINYDYGGICMSYNDATSTIVTILEVIIVDCFPPLVMSIFGLLTILNIRAQRNRVVPTLGGVNRQRRTETQLAQLLFWQVLNYLIFFLPISIIYTMITVNTSMQTTFFNFIMNICTSWHEFFYITPFFFYILTASVYRRELIRIICCGKNLFRDNQAFTNTVAMVPTGRDRTIIK